MAAATQIVDDHHDGQRPRTFTPVAEPRAPGAGAVLRLIRDGASTRPEIARRTGMGRATVTQRIEALLAEGLVVQRPGRVSNGGRPPAILSFNAAAGAVLAADLNNDVSHLAVTDLSGRPRAEASDRIDLGAGPGPALARVAEHFERMLASVAGGRLRLRAVGIGFPGAVSLDDRRDTRPVGLPGWGEFRVADWLADRFGVPVVADKSANLMAIGEHRLHWPRAEDLLFVHAGPDLSCGLILGGQIHRGAHAAAGSIGHVGRPGRDDPCRCGNSGCLEAIASGRALAARLGADDTEHVVRLAREGHPPAVRALREAAQELGEMLAAVVDMLGPSTVILGGALARANELHAGVCEVVFRRARPHLTRRLEIATSRLGERAGVIGAAEAALDRVLDPAAIDQTLANGAPSAGRRRRQGGEG